MKIRIETLLIIVLYFSCLLAGNRLYDDKDKNNFDIQKLQVIGWAENEKYWAARTYYLRSDSCYLLYEADWLPKKCKGYIDHNGKAFTGGLALLEFFDDSLNNKWTIQDISKCTNISDARAALEQAKKSILAHGIELGKDGDQFNSVDFNRFKAANGQEGTIYYYDSLRRVKEGTQLFLRGKQFLSLQIDSSELKTVFKVEFNEEILEGMAFDLFFKLYKVFSSPTGNRIAVFGSRRESFISWRRNSIFLFGVFDWDSENMVYKVFSK